MGGKEGGRVGGGGKEDVLSINVNNHTDVCK